MTNPLIQWLGASEDDRVDLVGGKGASLNRLLRLGLPVPQGFVITTAAYRAVLEMSDLAKTDIAGDDVEDDAARMRQRIGAALPDELRAAILSAYTELGAGAVAVRSSGTAEDLAEASFAGQHDTFLNVTGAEALLAAVRGCWASLWSARAVAYRRERRWATHARDLALAVIVQEMVPAEWAGVLFTADPVTGRRDRMVVEAVRGLGEALVSGTTSGERYVVEKASGRVVEGGGSWPREMLREVAVLGRRIEAGFGGPQDIEWACTRDHCAIVQARPLTALPTGASHGGAASRRRRRYSRMQRAMAPTMLDHMPLSPYPFDHSLFFRPFMERVAAGLWTLGFVVSPVDAVFIAVAEGVTQEVPPRIRPTPRALTLPAKLIGALRADPKEWSQECHKRLVAPAERMDTEDHGALSARELLERIEMLRYAQMELMLRRFGYLAPRLLLSMGFGPLLRLALGREAARRLTADLLAGVPCVTTDANLALAGLARRIRASAEARAVFRVEAPERVARRLDETDDGRAVRAEIDAFLRRFGWRESAMPAAALPAWRDDPDIVYGLLKGLTADDEGMLAADDAPRDDVARAEQARREVAAALSRGRLGLWRRVLLPRVLAAIEASRRLLAFREDSHFALLMPFTVIRRLALALGERLVARGALAEPSDIFYLTIEELTLAIDTTANARTTRERVWRRKAARQAMEGSYTPMPAELLERAGDNGELRGAPASRGRTMGSVRIIRDEREFWKLRRGEVLVAPYTNPAWTPLFALASAVVVDAGGMASHAAIVAREFGIPAVMGVGSATRRLRDGQRVLVDGERGRVTLLAEQTIARRQIWR
jgi:rifampicin phosphotransferase